MVLKPVSRTVVPSPLENQRKFDDFVTQYLNKCDDLISYTKRYPVVKETAMMTVQRQNRNPHEDHRWLRRDVMIRDGRTSYDELKSVLFVNRAEHLAKWTPMMAGIEQIESIVPHMCDVFRYTFKSQGLKAKRDYCQLVIKREFIGEEARPKPRLFTPSASVANLALNMRSQSSMNLSSMYHQGPMSAGLVSPPGYGDHSPTSPTLSINNVYHKGLKSARSVVDFHEQQNAYSMTPPPLPKQQMPQTQYAGLNPHDSMRQQWLPKQPNSPIQANVSQRNTSTEEDEMQPDASTKPIRRFQIVSVPMFHKNCTTQRGHVRAFYESYEEVREFSDGRVEWICIHHSDFSGWVPSFMSDRSIANAFPREADSLLEYVHKSRSQPLHNEY
ncbi:hypothetical protein IW140_005580 [Coemansia sp. RSA 1813]|nr:hypothetical protein EV178_005691 [Coemansia sp. RSA 1646]KAJ1767315.1 hypothetical protein LPJ74_005431 [Coemansia sp. RSA 1843]KAJ2086589.1 hypothetical protein IW138_005582 [Coemansia sp. RSA 986]KAJ2211810.1 hypothetical protein EV179_005181 [Coemansia sp. RSA 487]KAJ2564859.1 hypothetical protein IW140_005580 [Coemansia sp. RSA 1813]